MVNSGGRAGGACTAAMFLKEFAGGLPWAHLDIAGTAWADEAKPYQPKGADRRRRAHAGGAARSRARAGKTSWTTQVNGSARSSRTAQADGPLRA